MVFAQFWSEVGYNGIDFAHFGLESGMILEETTWVHEHIYRLNSVRNE